MSLAREDSENLHFAKYKFAFVGDAFFDMKRSENGEDDDDGAGEAFGLEEVSEGEFSAAAEVLRGLSDEFDTAGEDGAIHLERYDIPEEAVQPVFHVLHKVAMFYFHAPKSFEALMHKLYFDRDQSELARRQNITRQAVNKRLLAELGIAQKRNDIQERRDRELAAAKQEYRDKLEELRRKDEFFKTLSERDWRIYKLVFVDGCTYRSAAKQVGCSERTVCSVASFLASKMDKNCVITRGRPKKNQKNLKKNGTQTVLKK